MFTYIELVLSREWELRLQSYSVSCFDFSPTGQLFPDPSGKGLAVLGRNCTFPGQADEGAILSPGLLRVKGTELPRIEFPVWSPSVPEIERRYLWGIQDLNGPVAIYSAQSAGPNPQFRSFVGAWPSIGKQAPLSTDLQNIVGFVGHRVCGAMSLQVGSRKHLRPVLVEGDSVLPIVPQLTEERDLIPRALSPDGLVLVQSRGDADRSHFIIATPDREIFLLPQTLNAKATSGVLSASGRSCAVQRPSEDNSPARSLWWGRVGTGFKEFRFPVLAEGSYAVNCVGDASGVFFAGGAIERESGLEPFLAVGRSADEVAWCTNPIASFSADIGGLTLSPDVHSVTTLYVRRLLESGELVIAMIVV